MEFFPYIVVPIVGVAAIFSVTVSCCFYRWNQRQIENLENRVGGLERRTATTPLLHPPPTVAYPPPMMASPPPYRSMIPMATAPPPPPIYRTL